MGHIDMWTHYCVFDRAWISVAKGERCNWCGFQDLSGGLLTAAARQTPTPRGGRHGGHMNDGSSIQRHSAGAAYPFIVGYQDRPDGHFVMTPGGDIVARYATHNEAVEDALRRASARAL